LKQGVQKAKTHVHHKGEKHKLLSPIVKMKICHNQVNQASNTRQTLFGDQKLKE
jgi:hypothetical protein